MRNIDKRIRDILIMRHINLHFTYLLNNCGILFGRCESPIGRNALYRPYCIRRLNAALSDVLSGKFGAFGWKHAAKDIYVEHKHSDCLLHNYGGR